MESTKDIHVIPVFDKEPEHIESSDCWCEPELHYEDELTGKRVWSHRRIE